MTDNPYQRTIDWSAYWRAADDVADDDANGSAAYVVDPLLAFFAATGAPDSYADVGCGGGAAAFAVAERYSGADAVGYDAAETALAADRERARDAGLENVAFERAVLPAFDPDRTFDVVSAFFTLCYVPDVERALTALYDAVAPGGCLVVTYHNRHARAVFEGIAEAPHEHLDEAAAWDAETFADRFELVLSGESLLSYERIHDVLGTWPRSVWSVAKDVDRYGAWRQNPLVYVPK